MNLSFSRLTGAACALLLFHCPFKPRSSVVLRCKNRPTPVLRRTDGDGAGKVTEYFGDTWYIQDDFGAWNGIFCVGPTCRGGNPLGGMPRQPGVGDVFELTGTVVEQDGNTQLVDITEYEFLDYWNATPAGVYWTLPTSPTRASRAPVCAWRRDVAPA